MYLMQRNIHNMKNKLHKEITNKNVEKYKIKENTIEYSKTKTQIVQ